MCTASKPAKKRPVVLRSFLSRAAATSRCPTVANLRASKRNLAAGYNITKEEQKNARTYRIICATNCAPTPTNSSYLLFSSKSNVFGNSREQCTKVMHFDNLFVVVLFLLNERMQVTFHSVGIPR